MKDLCLNQIEFEMAKVSGKKHSKHVQSLDKKMWLACSITLTSSSRSVRSMSALGWRKKRNSRSPSSLSVTKARAVLAFGSNRTPEQSTLFCFKMSTNICPNSSSPTYNTRENIDISSSQIKVLWKNKTNTDDKNMFS